MKLELRFDPTSLDMAESGAIWAGIWLECKGTAFPEVGWNDMAVAFACELLDVARHLRVNDPECKRVRFFDGPFWVDLRLAEDGRLAVAAGSRYPDAYWKCITSLGEFVSTLEVASSEIVNSCVERGWTDQDDVRRLAAMVR